MKRSLGDKRRYLDQAALDAVTREHRAMENSQTSRVFDNSDFGYRRITVLRPLRLRFQITEEARERFLNTCPELFDALQAVQDSLGTELLLDWNPTWDAVQQVFKTLPDDVEGWGKGAKGTAQKKISRDCFTVVDPEAAPVIAKLHKVESLDRAALFPGQTLPADITNDELHALLGLNTDGKGKHIEYETDPALKDAESIPLKEDIVSYVLREVLETYNRDLKQDLAKSVWATTGASWYKLADGTITNNWPHSTIRYRRLLRAAQLADYETG